MRPLLGNDDQAVTASRVLGKSVCTGEKWLVGDSTFALGRSTGQFGTEPRLYGNKTLQSPQMPWLAGSARAALSDFLQLPR